MEQITLSEVTNFDRTIGNASASKGSAVKSVQKSATKTPLKPAEEEVHHEEIHHEQPTEEVPVVEEKAAEMIEEVPKTEEAEAMPAETERVEAVEEKAEGELLGKRPADEEQREAEEREETEEPEVAKKVKTDDAENKEEGEGAPSSTAFESL